MAKSFLKKSLSLLRQLNRARLAKNQPLVEALEAALKRYDRDTLDRQLPLFK